MYATLTGPMETQQINTEIYAGYGDILTIQDAVNRAVEIGGYINVVIPHGYSDTGPGPGDIESIVNGSPYVYIIDKRGGQQQYWNWTSTGYQPYPIVQQAGFEGKYAAVGSLNHYFFVGKPTDRFPTIQSAVDFAVPYGNSEVVITAEYTGNEDIGSIVNGNPSVYIIDERGGPRRPYFWYTAQAQYIAQPLQWNAGISSENINDYLFVGWGEFTNSIQAAVDWSAARAGIPVVIVITPRYTGTEIIGNLINGATWNYITDQRTSNWQNYHWNGTKYNLTPAGMQWPDPGIAVSDGSGWDASIDPATLATKTDLDNVASELDNYLPLTGGTLTGPLVLHADPVGALDAATKQYVDSHGGGGGGGTASGIWQKIAQVVVGAGGQATIDFNNIPQTHTNLRVIFSAGSNSSGDVLQVRVNGDSSTSYSSSYTYMNTSGSVAAGASGVPTDYVAVCSLAVQASQEANSGEILLPAYSSNAFYKTLYIPALDRTNISNTWLRLLTTGARWNNVAPITSLNFCLQNAGANFVPGTTITLYGDNGTAGGGGGGGGTVLVPVIKVTPPLGTLPTDWTSDAAIWTSGTATFQGTTTVDTTTAANPAPEIIYQSQRYSNPGGVPMNGTFTGFDSAKTYRFRFHWAESLSSGAQRYLGVQINGTTIVNGLDIFTITGGLWRAFSYDSADVSPDSSGNFAVVLNATGPVSTPFICGIEVFEVTGGGGGSMEWPPAGVAVSSGSSWASSINPADLPRLSAASNTFNGNLAIASPVNNYTFTQDGTSCFIDAGGPTARLILNGNRTAGLLAVHGDISCDATIAGGEFNSSGVISTTGSSGPVVDGSIRMSWTNDSAYFDAINTGATRGRFTFRQFAAGGASEIDSLTLDGSGNATFIGSITATDLFFSPGAHVYQTGGNLGLDGSGADGVLLNWFSGTGGMAFGNGNQTTVASVSGTGHATFASLDVSGAKNFRIPDPRDPSKYLIHSCLEGPEYGVFYRGEAVTFDGRVEITLPDYFETLTSQDGRSVQITEIDDDTDTFAQFKVSEVKDGKFTVRSSVGSARFHWMVNAIRKDLGPLEVNPTIPENERTIEGQ